MVLTDQEQLVQKPTLSASDQSVVERLFGRIPFERLAFALKWGWDKMDVERELLKMTYAQAVTKRWCSSNKESALRRRLAKFDYHERYITQTTYKNWKKSLEDPNRKSKPTDSARLHGIAKLLGDGAFLRKKRPEKRSTTAGTTGRKNFRKAG